MSLKFDVKATIRQAFFTFDDIDFGAKPSGRNRMTDVDVALKGQANRQPNGSCMKNCGQHYEIKQDIYDVWGLMNGGGEPFM